MTVKGWFLSASCLLCVAAAGAEVPDDFPRFQVPGHEEEMAVLRDLFWLHYPGSGPKATLWDEWLTDASLWPGVETKNYHDSMLKQWSDTLSARIIDSEGYVATHQHASIAHQLGWPFPFWNQGRHGCGWHFSFKNTAPEGWRPHDLSKPDGWTLDNAQAGEVASDGWVIHVTNAAATVTAPAWKADTFEVPFLQVRWAATGLGGMQPCIEWTSPGMTNFSPSRRMFFDPPREPGKIVYTMVPMYKHPLWTGEISQLRIRLGNTAPGQITLQAFFSQYDTRHNINAQNFVRGCAKYFWWSHDLAFLRANANRMRTGIQHAMSEYHTQERKAVFMTWIGHDGRSGLARTPDGKKQIVSGEGIGNNYWDLLPFGGLDAYATIQFYDSLLTMARLKEQIDGHPSWNIPGQPLSAAALRHHAEELKEEGNKLFWKPNTGRFVACIDRNGKSHDYGFTFLNCEAIYYDFATPDHAREVMSWLNGDRIIADDTARGPDIYHWRFAARSTTLRNLDWYFWAWNNPESIPWGGQVQDGGAVLGFAYHDLMARIKTLGPDNAWKRLREVLRWFTEVQAAGGYRKYYNGSREGTMQGSGTAGGLGLDMEFFESAMVPQVMLYGFMGFRPAADGFSLNPQLPKDWPELSIDRINFQGRRFAVKAGRDEITVRCDENPGEPLTITLPSEEWSMLDQNASANGSVDFSQNAEVRFVRKRRTSQR